MEAEHQGNWDFQRSQCSDRVPESTSKSSSQGSYKVIRTHLSLFATCPFNPLFAYAKLFTLTAAGSQAMMSCFPTSTVPTETIPQPTSQNAAHRLSSNSPMPTPSWEHIHISSQSQMVLWLEMDLWLTPTRREWKEGGKCFKWFRPS